jgi:hypothetical protein
MKTDIPTARKLLQEARNEAHSREVVNDLISRALSMMTRGRTKRITARIEGRAITPELEEQIWHTYQQHPSWSILSIANQHDVNPGRVSEVIARRSE